MLSSTHDTTIYPESDGKPMAETDTHRDLILLMIDLLRQAFPALMSLATSACTTRRATRRK